MPLRVPAGTISAVFLVRTADFWMERLRAALNALSRGRPGPDQLENPDAIKVVMHVDVLEQRLARTLDWVAELGRGARPSAVIAYTDMLEIGGQLPRYAWGPIHLTADLLNPANEAELPGWDEGWEAVEVVASLTHLFPWVSGTLLDGAPIRPGDPKSYAKMAAYGKAFGEAVALFAEHLEPHFAFADTGGAIRAIAEDQSRGPFPDRWWAHLWPITVWSRELLNAHPGLEGRLRILAMPPEALAKADAFERTGLEVVRLDVPGDRLFVQYRTILGGKTTRAAVELAQQVGLKPPL